MREPHPPPRIAAMRGVRRSFWLGRPAAQHLADVPGRRHDVIRRMHVAALCAVSAAALVVSPVRNSSILCMVAGGQHTAEGVSREAVDSEHAHPAAGSVPHLTHPSVALRWVNGRREWDSTSAGEEQRVSSEATHGTFAQYAHSCDRCLLAVAWRWKPRHCG
jgi:hypothetical protein